ncbi:16S rRNA processing protein RimM [Leptospira wolffii]|uniref:ribosome maturation factor RimM n=1 Tax=Leptospira wolffii TaxID=409998 RepID=UPI0010830072|nr:ribosome maturation factor RimM [Leptospira wolffii]TGK56707.1 16S rRNA processing protein RimM [Leptospira wolffii]TGK71711.1 16S rRNA processing protein RimM [Leptospira wolffii]TGK75432.1 16S rRNA processing protein RimM [Leptospira wolffii]TGL33078.1 16S rRNA processing protein RimM [Leptospira wolffii]
MTETRILTGKLGKPFGLKGLLRLVAQDSAVPQLKFPVPARIEFPGREAKEVQILRVQIQSGRIHLQLEGITTPEAASSLTGGNLYIERSYFPKSKGEEYYLFELKGLKAVSEKGEELGWVLTDIIENPAHSILVFQKEDSEILVPYVEKHIGKVLLEEGKIQIKDPEDWNEV